MYEDMTFENIMDRCLDRVSSSIDKREGSVVYDAIRRRRPNWRSCISNWPTLWTALFLIRNPATT